MWNSETGPEVYITSEIATPKEEFARVLGMVFRSLDPFDAPFTARVRIKRLVYPVTATLVPLQYDALFAAASTEGDDRFFAAITEGQSIPVRDPHNLEAWSFKRWDYEMYADQAKLGVVEHALYSPSGTWGLLFSHEQHCLIAGTQRFVEAVLPSFSDFENSVDRFKSYWKQNAMRFGVDVSWMEPMFAHLSQDLHRGR